MVHEAPTVESEPSDKELAWRSYQLLFGHYENDLRLFWVRANFYLVVNGGLLAFATQNAGHIKDHSSGASGGIDVWVLLGLCLLGFLVSALWWSVLKSSFSWIERWREKLAAYPWKLKGEPAGALAFSRIIAGDWPKERFWFRAKPSSLSLAAPVLFALSWAGLAIWIGAHHL